MITRMLSGPMDFTPGVLSLTGRRVRQIQSTMAKWLEIALAAGGGQAIRFVAATTAQ